MKYYIKEYQIAENTAGPKAREDIEKILDKEKFRPLNINITVNNKFNNKDSFSDRINRRIKIKKEWNSILNQLTNNDVILIQFPLLGKAFFHYRLIQRIKQKGTKVIILVHDLDLFRYFGNSALDKINRYRRNRADLQILNYADQVIVHNRKMKATLEKKGINSSKMVELEIFDYLIPGYDKIINSHFSMEKPIIIAGALRKNKAEYAYNLPTGCDFNLYGPGYDNSRKHNIHYKGSFPPDEIPFVIEGSFGLVWDGSSLDTCDGPKGNYLKINNPHKTSLYLACGLPILVWNQAAIAEFVVNNHCGIAINSLREVNNILHGMTSEKYQEYKNAALTVGEKLRDGYYTKKALDKAGL